MTEIISFSLPKGMLEKLDLVRGDIARSKFITRVLETVVNQETSKKNGTR
jgi:metal-responsive CopG/Arc/MetJ family transcriptional regulator